MHAQHKCFGNYAHRGRMLWNMPFYVYRMYVRRIPKPKRSKARSPNIFFFETHYALFRTYAQQLVLHTVTQAVCLGVSSMAGSEGNERLRR